MKKSTIAFAIAAALGAGAAQAADLGAMKAPPSAPAYVSPFEFAFGAAFKTDYNFRGISQSNRAPAVAAYGEARYNFNPNIQLYAGIAGSSVKLPTRPSVEIDLYAGIRPTIGPVAFDFGAMYYLYPNEQRDLANGINWNKTDFLEFYGKASYTWQMLTVGANLFYAHDWLKTGAAGTYGSLTAKVALPHGFAISGEYGHYWLGTTSPFFGTVNLPDYNYWNAGVSYTYKYATVDLRYHDTDLTKAQCFANTGDPRGFATGRSKWCGAAFIATLSFDISSKDWK